MSAIHTDSIRLRAEVYFELINDMQARIFEYESEYPDCMNEEIREINRQLSAARMESRINVNEEHFHEWDQLLLTADTAMKNMIIQMKG